MKILYLSTWDFTNEMSDGVCKKIKAQISVFEKKGYRVDFIYLKDGKIVFREDGIENIIGKVGIIKKTPAYIRMYNILKKKKYDWVYNRYGMMDTFYFRVLKCLNRNGAKILIEIPTYPYDEEKQGGLLYHLFFAWDRSYRRRLKNVADRIITYSKDSHIFDIPAIQVMNGIDLSHVEVAKSDEKSEDVIRLMIVAYMQPYHGYERLLKGLKNYYDGLGKRNIQCHFVGDGPERAVYEKLAAQYDLLNHTTFYGALNGEALNQIFDMCDIGVCSLGGYKKGLFLSSELKSREFLAKGLPIITGVDIDVLINADMPCYLQFSNDASDIDMEEIVGFYDRLYQEPGDIKKVREKIRHLAEKYSDMSITMQPVTDYMQDKENK